MFEVPVSEIRKGDLVILDNARKGKVRDVYEKRFHNITTGISSNETIIEIGLGEQLFLDRIARVLRRYQAGDWRTV